MEFYAVCSVSEPPGRMLREHRGSLFHCQLELPLPKHLVIFGLGNWDMYSQETAFSAEVSVGPEIKPQRIGMLSSAVRSLVWQGDWRSELTVASTRAQSAGWARLCLILSRQPGLTALEQEKGLNLDPLKNDREAWCPARPFFTPPNSTDSSNGPTHHQEKEMDAGHEADEKRLRTCPSPRWDHTLCLSDPDTAILIGGEGPQNHYCKDGVWKLEIDNGDIFWFPLEMTSTLTIPVPQCVRGHSATYDPDTKRIYIFGGKKDEECFNRVYILDTLTWKWSFVIGKGKVPSLAYHSAVVFQQELFIFGGLLFHPPQRELIYSNALYIFNPQHEIWYQPIVVGERPFPRCGHSATLLRDKLILFGGNRSRVFLNDLHILDLGFMEYVNIQVPGSPAPRCRHAAVPVGENKVLISGGYNLTGALQDVFIFNADTYSWSSLHHHALCAVPRAGHSLVYLSSSRSGAVTSLKLLVFGGSNSTGQYYNDTVQVTVQLRDEWQENPCSSRLN
ncbi:rab9 effector protein with kelch motifs isoform X2 [Narcine bancroftii]|uniref:rab9 effector protein with kelch motifs isoform X2 n=1 Tax=Narcine bancroftii TaxID=1343680 RepID=UPI003832102D